MRANFLLYQSHLHPASQSCVPHLSSPCPLILTPLNLRFLFRIDSWVEPGHGEGLVLFEKVVAEERIWERNTVWKKKIGKENQKKNKAGGRNKGWDLSVFSLLFTQSCPAEDSSFLTTPPQSALLLNHNQICILIFLCSVLWSRRLIRGRVPKEVQPPKDLDPNASAITYEPLILGKSVTQKDFLISKLDNTIQILPSSPGMKWDATGTNTLETVKC